MQSHTRTSVFKALSVQVNKFQTFIELYLNSTTLSDDHGGAGSEDCLKVNVYTPVGTRPDAKRESSRYLE